MATGRGEIMKEINVDLKDHYFILVDTGIHVSTAWAFGRIAAKSGRDLTRIISDPIDNWKTNLVNDFEEPVFTEHPRLKAIKEELYKTGAVYASLTGTGSCIYGIFNKKISNVKLNTLFKVYQLNTIH